MSRAIALLPVLFLIRLLQVFLNFPAEFGGMFRPEPFASNAAQPLLLLAGVIILFCATAVLKSTTRSVRKIFSGFLSFNYLLIALFHNRVGQRSFICEIIAGNLSLDELSGLYAMDFFFQEPWYFWGLMWLLLSAFILNRKNLLHLLPVLMIPVLLPLRLSEDIFPVVAGLAMATAVTTGIFLLPQQSAAGVLYFWSAGLVFTFTWMNGNAAIYRNSWAAALILSAVVWLPGILLNEYLRRRAPADHKPLSWLIPVFCCMTWLICLTNVPLGRNLFNLWFSVFSLHFAALTTLTVVPAAVVFLLCNRVLKIPARASLLFMAIPALFYYLLDCLVMFKTGLRPDLDTIAWVTGLSNINSLISTILSLDLLKEILLPAVVIPAIYLSAQRLSLLRPDSAGFRGNLTFALSAAIFYQIFTGMPGGLFKDPLLNLVASIQNRALMRNDFKNLQELTTEFNETGVKLICSNANPAATSPEKRNLILIMLESTANQYVSLFGHHEKTWPRLEKYRNRMEIFPFFFSCFPESSNADFCVMSGLYPPDYLLLRQNPVVPVQLLADHLKNAGFDCSMFFSGFLGDTGLSAFYRSRGFDRIYDAGNMPETGRNESWLWGVKEEHVTAQIRKLLDRFATEPEKPFFIYYRMLFPHAPFQSISGNPPVFSEEGYQQGNLVGRFKNCLLYQDAQIAGLLEHLDASALAGSTVVMLVADHGTMLGESGRLGHGWNLEPLLTNVPLVIVRPDTNNFKENLTTGSQVDILPTALALSGVQPAPPFFCQGRNLLSDAKAPPAVFLSSMSQLALVEKDRYHLIREKSGKAVETFKISRTGNRTIFSPDPAGASDADRMRRAAGRFNVLQTVFLKHLGRYRHDLVETHQEPILEPE